MVKPLTDKTLAQLRNAGLQRPRATQPGQPWTPRTRAEQHLLVEAQRLDRIRLLLLEELGRTRQETAGVPRAEAIAGAAREAERLRECPLAPAQLRAVAAAASGESLHDTARRLGMSFHTIRSQRQRAVRRLDARDIEHAVELCTTAGWITAGGDAP